MKELNYIGEAWRENKYCRSYYKDTEKKIQVE